MTVRDFIQELLLNTNLDDEILFTDGKKRFFEFNHVIVEREIKADDFTPYTYPIIYLDEI